MIAEVLSMPGLNGREYEQLACGTGSVAVGQPADSLRHSLRPDT
jgi:hypothetical protein